MDLFLAINPLSRFWKNRASGEYEARGLTGTCPYIKGMGGYAISLPRRILGVVKELLFLIGRLFYSLATWNGSHFKAGLIAFSGSVGEVFVGIIGVVCPPVAYQLDEWLYSHEEIYEYSLARWMEQREGRDRMPLLCCCFKDAAIYLDKRKMIDRQKTLSPMDTTLLIATSFLFALGTGDARVIGEFSPPDSDSDAEDNEPKGASAAFRNISDMQWWNALVKKEGSKEKLIAKMVPLIRKPPKPASERAPAESELELFVEHICLLSAEFQTIDADGASKKNEPLQYACTDRLR